MNLEQIFLLGQTSFTESAFVMFEHPLIVTIGWTLVHFLWQAALIAVVYGIVRAIARTSSASFRYATALVGMALMAVVPIATFAWVANRVSWSDSNSTEIVLIDGDALIEPQSLDPIGQQFAMGDGQPGVGNLEERPTTAVADTPSIAVADSPAVTQTRWAWLLDTVERQLPWLVAAWMVGVMLLAARLMLGLRRITIWRRSGHSVTQPDAVQLVQRLTQRLGLRCRVSLLTTERLAVPAVVGCFKPAVLLPASMLSGLSVQELEALLAHELAHIRRHDYLINIIQSVIETLCFYHPAVWWLSHQVRLERENCCDDIAVGICGNPLVLARTLTRMEEIRSRETGLAVAGSGGVLSSRIRRIVGGPAVPNGSWWPAGMISILALGMLLGGMLLTTSAATNLQDGTDQPGDASEPHSSVAVDGTVNTKLQEITQRDSHTGINQRVFEGIELTCGVAESQRQTSLAMKYTNVISYSFIPASVAKQLQAEELGTVRFEETKAGLWSSILSEQSDVVGDDIKFVDINAATQPLAENEQFFADSTGVFVPGHLATYGMNSTDQREFKVVRIERVALGIGKPFGPVNALVLDDDNSDFGLLGTNWQRQVQGENGERLVFQAADSTLYLTNQVLRSWINADVNPYPNNGAQGGVTVTSTGDETDVKREEQPGIRTLATHTYDLNRRTSTRWLQEESGTRIPADQGVTQAGVFYCMTLMFDVVAADDATGKIRWNHSWRKRDPIWRTISIVEIEREMNLVEVAVELFAVDTAKGTPIYKYLAIDSGKEVSPPVQSEKPQPPIPLRVVGQDNETVKRVELRAKSEGRSPAELWKLWQMIPGFESRKPNSITERETLVSAKAGRVFHTSVDAAEIVFSLPEGSGMRMEAFGDQVEVRSKRDGTGEFVVTHGKIQLLDQGGVVRAWASPDGGAEQLVVTIKEEADEFVMRLKTKWLDPDAGNPPTPVQCVVYPKTGAPENEEQSPHGAIRYELEQDTEDRMFRFRASWRYDVDRIRQEANPKPLPGSQQQAAPQQTEASPWPPILEPLLKAKTSAETGGETKEEPDNSQATPQDPSTEGWGQLARHTKLRSRLTLQTEQPTIGQPLRFQLELKNFGDEPQQVDLQRYEPFRVLKVQHEDFLNAATFIGMTPQTSQEMLTLKPGETHVAWKDVDLNDLYLLNEPGEVFVVAKGGNWAAQAFWQDSNRIKLDLQPGRLTPDQRLIGELLDRMPEDWVVSHQADVFFLSHAPSSLKSDAATIQIVLSDHETVAKQLSRLRAESTNLTLSEIKRYGNNHGFLIASNSAPTRWVGYRETIEEAIAASSDSISDQGPVQQMKASPDGPAKDKDTGAAQSNPMPNRNQPWQAIGTVTDRDGKPLSGVAVTAHCGMGTLFRTGTTKTDNEGKYQLDFGPGIHSNNPKLVQAATISVRLTGHVEQNLHRQGDCVAALEQPDEIGWGDRTEAHLFLPGQSKRIDFVMVPAMEFKGRVYTEAGKPAVDYRVSIRGEEMPPSSSVVAVAKTNERGEFQFKEVPPGFEFQLLVEPPPGEPSGSTWASPPITFKPPEERGPGLEYSVDGKPVDFRFQYLYLILKGEGLNWKAALKEAQRQELSLQWNGLSTDELVSAGEVYLELGK